MQEWCTRENIEKVMGRKLPADEQKDADLAEVQREAEHQRKEAEREKQRRIEEEQRHAAELAELERRYAEAQQAAQQAPKPGESDNYEEQHVEEEIDMPAL